jgi:hypothetical protein
LQTQLANHTTLFTCGICSSDTALVDCFLLSDFKKEIDASDLKNMFVEMLAPLNDINATKYQRNFAKVVEAELLDGILLDSIYSCRSCIRQLQAFYKQTQKAAQPDILTALAAATPGSAQTAIASMLFESEPIVGGNEDDSESDNEQDEPTTSAVRKVPKMALVNGHFRGRTPECLLRLTRVELSMVVRINCVYSLSMLKRGCHWGSTATVFSVLNDVNVIAQILPRIPGEHDWAIIRSALDSASPREFTYTPYNVIQALMWLEENNPLWEGQFQRPPGSEWAGEGSPVRQDAQVITAQVDDYEYLGEEMLGGLEREDGNPVNPGAPQPNTTNVLLVPADDHQDLETQVSAIIHQQTRLVFVSSMFCSLRSVSYWYAIL